MTTTAFHIEPWPPRKTIRVVVTAADIKRGVRQDSLSCPVARAMHRTMKLPYAVTRAWHNGYWVGVAALDTGIGLPIEHRLSRAVGDFTRRFDAGLPVEPFAFRVWR
jgi:hypothetical protein